MNKIASGVVEIVGLILMIVVALAIGAYAVGTLFWYTGVLYGLFAYLVAKLLGFDAVPSVDWFIGGTVVAALATVCLTARAIWTKRKG